MLRPLIDNPYLIVDEYFGADFLKHRLAENRRLIEERIEVRGRMCLPITLKRHSLYRWKLVTVSINQCGRGYMRPGYGA